MTGVVTMENAAHCNGNTKKGLRFTVSPFYFLAVEKKPQVSPLAAVKSVLRYRQRRHDAAESSHRQRLILLRAVIAQLDDDGIADRIDIDVLPMNPDRRVILPVGGTTRQPPAATIGKVCIRHTDLLRPLHPALRQHRFAIRLTAPQMQQTVTREIDSARIDAAKTLFHRTRIAIHTPAPRILRAHRLPQLVLQIAR